MRRKEREDENKNSPLDTSLERYVFVDSSAQGKIPLVYQIENTGADYPVTVFPFVQPTPRHPGITRPV